jgi:hypothetical protein
MVIAGLDPGNPSAFQKALSDGYAGPGYAGLTSLGPPKL